MKLLGRNPKTCSPIPRAQVVPAVLPRRAGGFPGATLEALTFYPLARIGLG